MPAQPCHRLSNLRCQSSARKRLRRQTERVPAANPAQRREPAADVQNSIGKFGREPKPARGHRQARGDGEAERDDEERNDERWASSHHVRRPASALIVAAKARYRGIFNFATKRPLTISLSTRPVDKAVGGLALRCGGEEGGHFARRLGSPAGLRHLHLTI